MQESCLEVVHDTEFSLSPTFHPQRVNQFCSAEKANSTVSTRPNFYEDAALSVPMSNNILYDTFMLYKRRVYLLYG